MLKRILKGFQLSGTLFVIAIWYIWLTVACHFDFVFSIRILSQDIIVPVWPKAYHSHAFKCYI